MDIAVDAIGEEMRGAQLDREAERLLLALERSRDGMADLRFASIHSVPRAPEAVDDALAGTYRLRGASIVLRPPIDWWGEPYADDSQAFFQNSFVFADPLLFNDRFPEALNLLAGIFADWLGAHPRQGAEHPHRYAWHDHAAAGRLVYMAYVLREGARLGLLENEFGIVLSRGVLEHVEFLAAEENYAANHNHGLFSDAALALAARSLEAYGPSQDWAKVAAARFKRVLDRTVAPRDALHLEHSPYYHWIIHGAISRFAEAGLFESLNLPDLIARMESAGAWLVAPDGTLPPIGDTPFGKTPPAAVKRASEAISGARLFPEAGYAAIKAGGSCLIATAAHHPTAHKHADDGSFCLYEGSRPLVIDAGDPGHSYGSADRGYGTSPAAHATISIDDHDWVANGDGPYGSGMVAAAERDNIYALLVVNPGAVPGHGEAMRLFAYSPASFLVVIDLIEADPGQIVRRYVPLAGDLAADVSSAGRVGIHRDGTTVATLVSFSTDGAQPEGVELVVGRQEPQLGGYYYPSPGDRRPRCSIALVSPVGQPRALALMLDEKDFSTPELSLSRRDGFIEVEVRGVDSGPICLRTDSTTLELTRSDV